MNDQKKLRLRKREPIAEGRIFRFEKPDSIRTDFLTVIPYRGMEQSIQYKTSEFSAVCPFSGLPDIGTIFVEYIPGSKIVELKSLKYYLVSFRNVGIYQEEATNRIFKDLYLLLRPKYMKVATIYNTRGGIDSTCSIERGRKSSNRSRILKP
ncbi:MAG: preQ(1) synthase [Acidobacteriota bacterium]